MLQLNCKMWALIQELLMVGQRLDQRVIVMPSGNETQKPTVLPTAFKTDYLCLFM